MKFVLVFLVCLAVFFRLAAASDAEGSPARLGDPQLPVKAHLTRHCGWIQLFSPDGAYLLTTDVKTVQVWNVKTLHPIGQPISCGDAFHRFYFVAHGTQFFIESWPHDRPGLASSCFNSATATAAEPLPPPSDGFSVETISEDGRRYLVGKGEGVDRELRLIDRGTSRTLSSYSPKCDTGYLTLNADGSLLLYQSINFPDDADNRFHLVRTRDGKELLAGALQAPELDEHKIAFSPDGKRLAVGTTTGFGVYDCQREVEAARVHLGPEPVAAPDQTTPWITSLYYSADGSQLLARRPYGTWRRDVAAAATERLDLGPALPFRLSFDGHFSRVGGASGVHLAGATMDGAAVVVDPMTGKALWKWPWPREDFAGEVLLSPDGNLLVLSDQRALCVDIVDLSSLPRGPATQPAEAATKP